MFLLFIKFKFLWKNGVPEKIKAHLPLQLPALQQLVSPHLFNFIQKMLCPTHLKKRIEMAFYRRDYKGETIKLLPFYMKDFLIYRTVKS